MTELSIGISLVLPAGPAENTALIDPLLAAFESSAWLRPLRHLMCTAVAGRAVPRRDGLLRLGERHAVLRELLTHPDVRRIWLSSASPTRSDKEFASLVVETRPKIGAQHAVVAGRQWLDAKTDGDGWLAAMLTMAEATDAQHGTVPVMESAAVSSETVLIGLLRDGVLQHPFPSEFERMDDAQRELGARYVRFPRWGTIYARHHVEVLGGVERIRAAVQPAIVREFGPKAWYFQLTESVATATGAEALEKQRRFTELAEPLLPPVRHGQG